MIKVASYRSNLVSVSYEYYPYLILNILQLLPPSVVKPILENLNSLPCSEAFGLYYYYIYLFFFKFYFYNTFISQTKLFFSNFAESLKQLSKKYLLHR